MGARGRPTDHKRNRKMVKMRDGGALLRDIGERFGLSLKTVARIVSGSDCHSARRRANERLAEKFTNGQRLVRCCLLCGANSPGLIVCCACRDDLRVVAHVVSGLNKWREGRHWNSLNIAACLIRKHGLKPADVRKFYGEA